ncbi:MAG: DUF6328 family protein [Bdellovibrionales bacterium]
MNENPPELDKSNPAEHTQYVQSLTDQVNTVEQEARMVLPGIQALFGFQMIAVFNQGFKIELNENEQIVHLVALLFVAISAILVITPAAYHRQARHQISTHFLQLSSNFLAWALAPLAIGSCLDIYLIARVIVHSHTIACAVTFLIFLVYLWAWFILPRLHGRLIKSLPVAQVPK